VWDETPVASFATKGRSVSLLAGLNHVAILTSDLDRFIAFYTRLFELEVVFTESAPAFRHAILRIGADSWLHPAEVPGNPHVRATLRVFDRGHLDHIALTASCPEAFERIRKRLMEAGASDGAVDDLGPFQTLWFEDPDGMRGEITVIVDPRLQGIHAPRPRRAEG
jgi:catechol 2,3-dioxygenase-like lactoylglutathione lyase family enzyme